MRYGGKLYSNLAPDEDATNPTLFFCHDFAEFRAILFMCVTAAS
jgi:hypothetical protein